MMPVPCSIDGCGAHACCQNVEKMMEISKNMKYQILKATSFLFRKIDDVTWFNNPDALQDLVNRLALDQDEKALLMLQG